MVGANATSSFVVDARFERAATSDIAGSDPTSGFVEMAVRELGPERVIYGSDSGGRSFASQLGKVMGAQVPATVKDRILAANLRELMMPILQAKGIRA